MKTLRIDNPVIGAGSEKSPKTDFPAFSIFNHINCRRNNKHFERINDVGLISIILSPDDTVLECRDLKCVRL